MLRGSAACRFLIAPGLWLAHFPLSFVGGLTGMRSGTSCPLANNRCRKPAARRNFARRAAGLKAVRPHPRQSCSAPARHDGCRCREGHGGLPDPGMHGADSGPDERGDHAGMRMSHTNIRPLHGQTRFKHRPAYGIPRGPRGPWRRLSSTDIPALHGGIRTEQPVLRSRAS